MIKNVSWSNRGKIRPDNLNFCQTVREKLKTCASYKTSGCNWFGTELRYQARSLISSKATFSACKKSSSDFFRQIEEAFVFLTSVKISEVNEARNKRFLPFSIEVTSPTDVSIFRERRQSVTLYWFTDHVTFSANQLENKGSRCRYTECVNYYVYLTWSPLKEKQTNTETYPKKKKTEGKQKAPTIISKGKLVWKVFAEFPWSLTWFSVGNATIHPRRAQCLQITYSTSPGLTYRYVYDLDEV